MKANHLLFLCLCWLSIQSVCAQHKDLYHKAGNGNPILPGYFADPTVKKIGDTYYLYATTDGTGWGAGPSTVWTSKDFVNWTIQPMNWPNTHWYWAPDMTQGYDGRYYLYYSQPVELYGAVSDSPLGPWTSLEGDKAIIPNYMIPGVITLDGQTFVDDDGKIYMFWGTWGIYPDHGCAVGLLNEDMKTFARVELIPNTVAKEFFEAPIMFKREGIYYLLYSSGHCEDHTYRVQYVKSKHGPFGPYEYPDENPILVTNEDGTIHGPGHNDVITIDGRYYIVYHRHNNPHAGGGFHRQVAIDELLFDKEGNILKVVPTHQGIGLLGENTRPYSDLAYGKSVTASSSYSDDFRADFTVDNNNGTLWRASNNTGEAWLQIDLEQTQNVQSILLEMEYPTYAYQYILETSEDGNSWSVFKDNRHNNRWASPIIEKGNVDARYIRLRILHTQIIGLPRGVWNIKVFSEQLEEETIWSLSQAMPTGLTAEQKTFVKLDAAGYEEGDAVVNIVNSGDLAGEWSTETALPVKVYQGKKAFYFNGENALVSSFDVPLALEGNAAYTVSMWINNPTIERLEPILTWSRPGHDLTLANFGYGSDINNGAVTHGGWANMAFGEIPTENQWQHIVICFDGYMERMYVNGKLQDEQNKMLFMRRAKQFRIGQVGEDGFSGYVASVQVTNYAWHTAEILEAYQIGRETTKLFSVETADMPLGTISHLMGYDATLQEQRLDCIDGEIAVFDRRIGIRAEGLQAPALVEGLHRAEWVLELDVYQEGAWQHVMVTRTKKKNGYQVYRNGARTDDDMTSIISWEGNTLLWKGEAMHALRLYAEVPEEQLLGGLYQSWQNKSKRGISTAKPAMAPYRINDKDIFVAVPQPSMDLHYMFDDGNQSSGWIKQPYYLFSQGTNDEKIGIRTKDIYGNVSDIYQAPIFARRAIKEFPKATEAIPEVLAVDTISFWDNLSLPEWRDSANVHIRYTPDQWEISSKDTKWGTNELSGPFLFKEIDGDFTFEVKLADVTGQTSKTRTSSESGIMIQDASDAKSYINNTILTGWNLGNLTRSIGENRHLEGNTGKGLDYDPYLQIQKVGAYFYLRSSADGITWIDLPNSPFHRADLQNKKLRVGIYQVANNNQQGYGVFEGIKIWLFE